MEKHWFKLGEINVMYCNAKDIGKRFTAVKFSKRWKLNEIDVYILHIC